MELRAILNGIDYMSIVGDDSVDVSSISVDSRQIKQGALFCCAVGVSSDGHLFIDDALARGASALLVERAITDPSVPVARVESTRSVLGEISSRIYGKPQESMRMVGITGTNGKTTTVQMLNAIFQKHGWSTGVIGTLSGTRTTPEAPDYYQRLKEFRANGIDTVVMEVSSHALDQGRVNGTVYDLGIFTNLTQDHLDYHQTMHASFDVKAKLFKFEHSRKGVINRDDPYGAKIIHRSSIPIVSFGLDDISSLVTDRNGSSFIWDGIKISIRLAGSHNVYNALAAATAARELGITPDAIADGLHDLDKVDGRMEKIEMGQPFSVFVDYAHTPDGLKHVITASKSMLETGSPGRIVVVFGCGGDRDGAKRPAMGLITTSLADYAILTSDNPRSEDPWTIIKEVEEGVIDHSKLIVEPDRRTAIKQAVEMAHENDILIIAGKGHETNQEIAGKILPFDDRQVVREEIQKQKETSGW